MLDRGPLSLRRRNWFTVLLALLLALNLPLSMSLAAMAAPDRNDANVPTMSCHEPATPASRDDGKPDPVSALQHLCCFTGCLPLAPASDAALALASPAGEPLPTFMPSRPAPRAIGVDPPPPKT
jgi:hypothetical protein